MSKLPFRWIPAGLLLAGVGCMQPGYMYGPGYPYQYQQPMYAPPGSLGAPGTTIIPPSNAPLYDPGANGSTYEKDPTDTWTPGGTNNGMFEGDSGGVPAPKEPGTGTGTGNGSPFFEDLNGSGVQLIMPESPEATETASSSRQDNQQTAQVAARPVSYGFDINGYRWIQGILTHDDRTGDWRVVYNLSQDDPFLGELTLAVNEQQMQGITPGIAVQVRGQVDSQELDGRGRATYRVTQIYELPMAVAQLR